MYHKYTSERKRNEYEWNCKNVIDDCYIEQKNINIITCSKDNCTDVIHCNSTKDGCRVICQEDESCYGHTIICGDNKAECNIICIGDRSCAEMNIFGGLENEIEIICQGMDSCNKASFVQI